MKANYNVTGNDRKALVAAIEKLTGDKAFYMRMPTCAYEIGDVTVDKEGGVTCEDADKLERIIHSLISDGFTPEDTEVVESDDEATGLTVSLPLDKVAVGNLTNLLTAKESLIKKALGSETSIKQSARFSLRISLATPAGRTAHRKRRWQHANDHERAA